METQRSKFLVKEEEEDEDVQEEEDEDVELEDLAVDLVVEKSREEEDLPRGVDDVEGGEEGKNFRRKSMGWT